MVKNAAIGQLGDERSEGRNVKISEVSVREEATMTEATEQERFGSDLNTRRNPYRGRRGGRYHNQCYGGYRGDYSRARWKDRDHPENREAYNCVQNQERYGGCDVNVRKEEDPNAMPPLLPKN